MSAPNASSSSSALVSFTQDVDYTHTEGFKRFKSSHNRKNAQAACNDPRGAYLTPEEVFQAVKGPGCSQWSFDGLLLEDFITSGSVAAHRRLKCLSLAPYYAAQMKYCTQKWDRCDDQGPGLDVVNTCCQLVGVVGTGLYYSMADVQMTVRSNCGSLSMSTNSSF